MDVEHRELIRSNLNELVRLIHLELLVPVLITEHVFTGAMLDDILSQETDTAKKEMLIVELLTRGPHAFTKFVEVLNLSGLRSAAALLDPPSQAINSVKPQVVENVPLNHNGENRTRAEVLEDNYLLQVKPASKWMCGEDIYAMKSNPRGYCLLINNVDFVHEDDKREGSDLDALRLRKVFNLLAYEIEEHRNADSQMMKEKILAFSKKPHFKKVDSSVVIILSHGHRGEVLGTDYEAVSLEWIFQLFNNSNCPYLQGKPKMFFIQACQGETIDIGTPMHDAYDAAPVRKRETTTNTVLNFSMPAVSDTFISYSTVEGYVSVRNPDFGSWYCQELVLQLCENAHNTDLEGILRLVDGKVKKRLTFIGEKQATQRVFKGCDKVLYFNPGLTVPAS